MAHASERYRSWGRYPRAEARAVTLDTAAVPTLPGSLLPFGNGRSYGDVCLNPGGTLLDTRKLGSILSLDTETGVLEAEAGVTLAAIIEHAVPKGWFVPVTPGTRWVTLGGAIANDVHGKNHHVRGTFGSHVTRFELVRSTGERLRCSPTENVYLYQATIGGLGLTGLVTKAAIRMIPVSSGRIDQEIIRFGRLDEYVALAAESDRRFEYSVAWIDQLATGENLGRGLFIRGNHAEGDERNRDRGPFRLGGQRFAVPVTPPVPLIQKATLKAFNALYWRQVRPGSTRSTVSLGPFFYPLDAIGGWNRLYGPRGLLQHQCVVPGSDAIDVVRRLITESQRAGIGSFLTVLKTFGTKTSPGLLSFPRPGLTLTLDYANTGQRVLDLIDRLDRIVMDAGGAINPSKDARMSPATFAASLPRWRDVLAAHDPAFSSGFWRRVTDGAA